MAVSRHREFPIGNAITIEELERDPYPAFARLRVDEPITWIRALQMWYVTGYEDVRSALLDTTRLTTASPRSTIFDTFGAHMLTTEGEVHDRYRKAMQYPFAVAYIRQNFETAINYVADALIGEFSSTGQSELRASFASRLPIRVILFICGLPTGLEREVRRWYDSFEAALANFIGDEHIRAEAARAVREFHAALDSAMADVKGAGQSSLLATLVNASGHARLSDEEIKRNLSIVFFGGISTVEALLLNSLWALFEHPDVIERIHRDASVLDRVLDETMRWLSPVQSATRHATESFEWHGARVQKGDVVNCMLGAANRDPAVFPDPDAFDIDRPNLRRQLGFGMGVHACLGMNLARTEARIGLATLLRVLANLTLAPELSEPPTGYEFRQPRSLAVRWKV